MGNAYDISYLYCHTAFLFIKEYLKIILSAPQETFLYRVKKERCGAPSAEPRGPCLVCICLSTAPAAHTPCPGFAASAPAQRLVALSEIGTNVCLPNRGRQWWVQRQKLDLKGGRGGVLHSSWVCSCRSRTVQYRPSVVVVSSRPSYLLTYLGDVEHSRSFQTEI